MVGNVLWVSFSPAASDKAAACEVVTREAGPNCSSPVMARSETSEFGRYVYARDWRTRRSGDVRVYLRAPWIRNDRPAGEQAEDLAATVGSSTLMVGTALRPAFAWCIRQIVLLDADEHGPIPRYSQPITSN